VVFGSGGVGKTSLVQRFLLNRFDNNYTATIEDDYREVITYNNHIVDVTVLDTAGTYQFPAMRRHAIQHGHGFIIVYSVDDAASLEEAKRLYDEVIKFKDDDYPIVLVGNKIDKSPLGKRKVTRDEVNRVLLDNSMMVEHVETSAKINHNVSLVFNKLIGFIDSRNMENLTAVSNMNNSFSKSTMILNSMSKNSLNTATTRSTFNLQRSLSMDDHLNCTQEKRKTKRKMIKKFFSSRKSMH